MKKTLLIILISTIVLIAGCTDNSNPEEKLEQARLDSIAQLKNDSLAKIKAIQDSIAFEEDLAKTIAFQKEKVEKEKARLLKAKKERQEKLKVLNKVETKIDKWYEGGNLHKATILEWKKATEKNKLATCGDFMAKIDNSVTMAVVKERAMELKKCIDEATRGLESTNNEKVSDIAASCIILMGYN